MTRRLPRAPGGRRAVPVVLVAATALLLAGCGGGDDEASGRTPVADVTIDPRGADGTIAPGERPYFAEDSPWNTRVDGAPVDPRSKEMMELATLRLGVRESGDRVVVQPRRIEDPVYINTESWTTPVVAGGQPTDVVCRQARCGDGDDTVVLDIPADIDPDPRYDGWFTILDSTESVAYDLWRARREDDGSISYHFMRKWDLDGPGYSPPHVVGARGSGLPLFAGLIRPGELQAGEIDHALAISVPGPAEGSFVQPASSTDGNGSADSLPEGARIRLRADVVPQPPIDPETGRPVRLTAQQQRLADAIVVALRTYGAIVVDRARVPTLYAQRDVTADLIRGNELQGLFLDDFEVVELPAQRHQYPPEHESAGSTSTGRD
ncbi:hypothetical protein GGQ22_01895 [Nocardioides sp. zg-579]|uniref:Lipoprotein n=1 Tax=Nocardioides marmotae TaxID=2663857 RepID=A0A6I3J4E2_9ACTN|nr:hypothetical protein [Nocardioides marmotae]MCR6030193.1 hypothetical protein [Gordonia jinghuaiqii]MTB93824.1 hypothetical protein [Nocardioides marmotae]QKE00156.1 hypothetical protein HPC71_02965 [Nocardioides marmotae]